MTWDDYVGRSALLDWLVAWCETHALTPSLLEDFLRDPALVQSLKEGQSLTPLQLRVLGERTGMRVLQLLAIQRQPWLARKDQETAGSYLERLVLIQPDLTLRTRQRLIGAMRQVLAVETTQEQVQ